MILKTKGVGLSYSPTYLTSSLRSLLNTNPNMADQSVSPQGSAQEQELLKLRKDYMRLLNNSQNAAHHLEFLSKARDLRQTPRGLRLYLPVNVIGGSLDQNDDLKNDVDKILKEAEATHSHRLLPLTLTTPEGILAEP